MTGATSSARHDESPSMYDLYVYYWKGKLTNNIIEQAWLMITVIYKDVKTNGH